MSFIRLLPLTLIVIIVYNLAVFGMVSLGGPELKDVVGGTSHMVELLRGKLFDIKLVSGMWTFSYGSLFVTLGLFALFIEIMRSTRTDTLSIANHALSTMVLVLCLLEFVVVPGFNTSEFFYLTVMAMIDVVAGFTITIISARRDFGGPGVAL
jgi:hypothetical protein